MMEIFNKYGGLRQLAESDYFNGIARNAPALFRRYVAGDRNFPLVIPRKKLRLWEETLLEYNAAVRNYDHLLFVLLAQVIKELK